MKKAILITFCFALGLSTLAFAGNNAGVAKGTIHVRPHNAKAGCSVSITGCGDIVMTELGDNFDAFPVFYDLVEFKGCEYGVIWPTWTYGADFTNCADLIIGGITNPGDGVSHSWLACQTSSVCIPAYLWLYADGPGQVCITGRPDHPTKPGTAFVLDCDEGLDVLIGWGCAGVYGGTPDPASGDACAELPPPATEPTTWGGIKTLFQ
jgi:hypothetical protein